MLISSRVDFVEGLLCAPLLKSTAPIAARADVGPRLIYSRFRKVLAMSAERLRLKVAGQLVV